MAYTISDLTLDEVNVIIGGLGKLALEVSQPVFMKVQQQIIPQVQAEQQAGSDGEFIPAGSED